MIEATDQNSYIPAYFNQKPFAATHNVEKATAAYAAEHFTKGKFTLSSLGTPYLYHLLTYNTAFEHTYLYLILSDCLSATDVKSLNETIIHFTHFH